MNILEHTGRYFLMLGKVFRKPEKFSVYRDMFFREVDLLGISSFGIVVFVSVFVGAAVAVQAAFNIDDPLIPDFYIGLATRASIILEFAPTMISLILAGKIGSNIASNIGTMRVTEQIDAIEVMGINSASYLILPKVLALLFINPLLIIFSMVFGIFGGWLVGAFTPIYSAVDFVAGITMEFEDFHVIYALIKTYFFAFVIASVSAYQGYYTKGGAVEVGKSSTRAVVYSIIVIIVLNYILTQLLLS